MNTYMYHLHEGAYVPYVVPFLTKKHTACIFTCMFIYRVSIAFYLYVYISGFYSTKALRSSRRP